MSEKPVYLETWAYSGGAPIVEVYRGIKDLAAGPEVGTFSLCSVFDNMEKHFGETRSRAQLAAAATALVRALLSTEWRAFPPYGAIHKNSCSDCGNYWVRGHSGGCVVDDALTAAGLPDQPSRDEARRLIAEAAK